ncbi:MAG: hypothetical protein Alpg2KO_33540 [Alphaproteobacteria bacterium]
MPLIRLKKVMVDRYRRVKEQFEAKSVAHAFRALRTYIYVLSRHTQRMIAATFVVPTLIQTRVPNQTQIRKAAL